MSDDDKTREDDDRFAPEKGSDREKRSSSPPKRARSHRDGIKHIFVGPTGRRKNGNDIEYYANEPELKEKFNQFGKVTDVKVRSNAKDVFAFVTFETSEDAGRAIAGMNGKALKGVKVKCDWGAYNGDRAVRRPPPFRRSPPRHRSSRGYDRDYDRYRYERSYRRRSPSPRYSSRYRRSPSPRYRRRSPSPRYRRAYSRSPRRYERRSPERRRRSPERRKSPERRRSTSRPRSESPRRSRS